MNFNEQKAKQGLAKLKTGRVVFGDADVIEYLRKCDYESRKKDAAESCNLCDGGGERTETCDQCDGTGEVTFECECQNV